MKIGFASDHRGYQLKKYLIEELEKNYEIEDYGTYSEESVDYPDYAFILGENVVNKNVDFGIKLLKDTMVLIDEGVASNSNDENNKDELLENFMKRSNDEVGSNKKAIMVSSAATMTMIFLLEGIVFARKKRKKKIKKKI